MESSQTIGLDRTDLAHNYFSQMLEMNVKMNFSGVFNFNKYTKITRTDLLALSDCKYEALKQIIV
jgi:hypothetical protein